MVSKLLIFSRQNWVLGVTLTLNTDQKVKDATGTSGYVKRSGFWKKFWEEKTGEKFPAQCQRYECTRKADLGAHVFVDCIYEEDRTDKENPPKKIHKGLLINWCFVFVNFPIFIPS